MITRQHITNFNPANTKGIAMKTQMENAIESLEATEAEWNAAKRELEVYTLRHSTARYKVRALIALAGLVTV